jgi:hypothetical protein
MVDMDIARFRVPPGDTVHLRRYSAADTRPFKHKHKAAGRLERGVERLVSLQELLYAQDRWSLLLIFQGMDAAGKDSAIKHVMSGLNPQGTQVYSFKRPSDEELDHDYLWRSTKALPERGRIGIFNRSYYEEVLVVRVHAEILGRQKLPSSLVTKRLWSQRYEDINAYERYLARNGTVIRSVSVDFGDGTTTSLGAITGTAISLHHVYQLGGTYSVVLTAADSNGGVGTAFTSVFIQTATPLAVSLTATSTPSGANTTETFTATVLGLGNSVVVSYHWVFGSTLGTADTTSNQVTRTYAAGAGTITVTVTITTSTGTQATGTTVIVVP